MAVLHGGWQPDSQTFVLWGEAWQRLDDQAFLAAEGIHDHPYCVAPQDFADWLIAHGQPLGTGSERNSRLGLPSSLYKGLQAFRSGGDSTKRRQPTPPPDLQWSQQVLALPTEIEAGALQPLHSAVTLNQQDWVLFPWYVTGLQVSAEEAITLLLSLPLGQGVSEQASSIGSDLRYWGHVARWGLDLLARGKMLPAIELTSQHTAAAWTPLLDSAIDQSRLRQFTLTMPPVCLSYSQAAVEAGHPEAAGRFVPLLAGAENLVLSFLDWFVDARVRAVAKTQPVAATTPLSRELPVRSWLQGLASPDKELDVSPSAASRLREVLNTWTAPLQTLQGDPTTQYRICLELTPPEPGTETWRLDYWLQSVADPAWRVAAEAIWQHPVATWTYQGHLLKAPQETLLAGLGRAARLYEPIRQSLQEQQPTHCLLDPIQAYQFIKASAWQLQDNGFGVELPSGLSDRNGSLDSRLGLKVRAEVPGRKNRQRLGLKSLLNFQWDISIGGETVSKEAFEQLLAQRSPLVNINGQWVELRPQEVKAAQSFFANQKTETPLSVEDALRISTGETQVIDKLPVVSFEATGALQTLIETLTTGNQTLPPVTEPDGFKGTLRPYQARGVSWLAFLEQWGLGACLADDMGLGKTIQLIAFLLYLRQQDFLEGPTLLVCPTSVLGNWEKEVHRFAPDLKTLIYHGDKRPHGSFFKKAAQGKHLIITSYALLHRDLKDLQRVEWQGIVLDEAQNIKNPQAKQSKAARQLDAQFRIALTGTPVENRLGELWAIMDFLNPGYLGPHNFFQKRFATPIERYGDTASLQALRSLVQPFILRRLKTDRDIIQDLPEKQEMTVFCGLSAEQATLYQTLVDESLAALNDAEGVQRRGQILALLTKLKQICNHPAQFLGEKTVGSARRSAKLLRLDEMLEELLLEGDRALIFTQFAEWGKLLKTHLERDLGEDTLFLYGSTSKKQREEMVDRFQNDPAAPRIFILSLKAGGVGLNLTRANHVFHFDRWWNPAVENQATDRAFRIGQQRNVQVHKFVCNGTLEERIHEMIESKQALSEQVVGTGEDWLTELDTDQLRNLLLLDRNAIIDEEG